MHPISSKIPNEIANLLIIFVPYQERFVFLGTLSQKWANANWAAFSGANRRRHALDYTAIAQNVGQAGSSSNRFCGSTPLNAALAK